MKRLCSILICLAVVLCLCTTTAFAAGTIADCARGDHDWKYQSTKSYPTVTEGGVEIHQCTVCYTTTEVVTDPKPIQNVYLYWSGGSSLYSANLEVGETFSDYYASTYPSGGASILTYSSSDPNVATVAADGTVTAVGCGSATIYATAPSGAKDSFYVYVKCCPPTVTTVSGPSSVTVNWNVINGATGYTVSRAPSEDGTYTTVTVLSGMNSTSYTDINVLPGNSYWYKVRAIADSESYTGDLSEAVLGVVQLPAPQNVKASNNSGNVSLKWDAVSNAQFYYVYRSTKENGPFEKIGTLNNTAYTDTKAAPGRTHYYAVAAAMDMDGLGLSEKSEVVSVGLPFPARTLSATQKTSGVVLKWNAASAGKGYAIYRKSTTSDSYKLIKTLSNSKTNTYTDTTARVGQTYSYKIKVLGSTEQYDSALSAAVSLAIKNSAPTLKSATVASGTITVNWTKVAGCEGYTVYRSTSKAGPYRAIKSFYSANALTYKDTAVSAGKTYYYKVVADGSAAKYDSAFSNVKSAVIKLTAPKSVSASAFDSAINVKWAKVSGASGYTVFRSTSKTGRYVAVANLNGANANSYRDTSVSGGKTYFYKIRANGTASVYHSAQSAAASAATRFRATTVSATGYLKNITLKWNAVSGSKGYTIFRSTSANGKYVAIKTITRAAVTTYKDTTIESGNTYYYKVRTDGTSSKFNSDLSNAAGATATLTAPTMGTEVTSTAKSVQIRWSKVASANGYVVYRRANARSAWTKIATVSKNVYVDNSTTKTFDYCVCAYANVKGKIVLGNRSEPIRATALAKATNLNATTYNSDTSDSLDYDRITWNPVRGATGYIVYGKLGGNHASATGWTKHAVVTGTSYTRYDPDSTHSQKYYYKVQPIMEADGVTCTGPMSSAYAYTIWYYNPKYSTYMSYKTDSSTSAVAVNITNKGSQTMRIYAKNARTVDHDYSSYNREGDGYIYAYVNGVFTSVKYIDIAPGTSVTISFGLTSSTWYDKKTTLYFDFDYDGQQYRAATSYYYGGTYSKR